MISPGGNSMTSWLSPSNVTILVLAGFLFVGHSSNWDMLHGRTSSRRLNAASPGTGRVRSAVQSGFTSDFRQAERATDSNSVVADNRPAASNGQNRRAID
jgi:hypothetical protein